VINDLSVVVISISVIVLCWAVVRINQKLDETLRNSQPDSILDPWPRGTQPGHLPLEEPADAQAR
jgi:hypothetical protein